jgi:hypothetical protein
MTLGLFGPDCPWQHLWDDQPIVSGQHPLHLYHGYLGASSLLQSGTPSCFDPAFQAGYPKTPVFDSGSRPAELFLALAGGAYRPAAYKVGLAICCVLVPLWLALASRGVGLGPGPSCLAAGLGLLVWWGQPCQNMLRAGDLDLLLVSLAAVLHIGQLIRLDRAPGVRAWGGLLAADCLGWFAQPLFFATLIPLNLLYYLLVGVRHRLSWHLVFITALLGGIGIHFFWLDDWVIHWWIRSPLPGSLSALTALTLPALWNSPLWGLPVDRALAVTLLAGALLGLVLMHLSREQLAARLLLVSVVSYLALAIAGDVNETAGCWETSRLLVLALWLAMLPTVYALAWGLRLPGWSWPRAWLGGSWGAQLWTGAVLLSVLTFWRSLAPAEPLLVGLNPQQKAVLEALAKHTTPQARILWEDPPVRPSTSAWTALLPVLTQRTFLGGLAPRAAFDYAYADMVAPNLAGRPLAEWSADELADFCRRYNIGWVVCWSPAVAARFSHWQNADGQPLAEQAATLPPDPATGEPSTAGTLFRLRRPHSFILRGQARWLSADCERIVLGDVVPEDGKVVLSLHYQAGLQVSPSRIQIERELDLHDPIPFVRLCLPGPVSRIILSWGQR